MAGKSQALSRQGNKVDALKKERFVVIGSCGCLCKCRQPRFLSAVRSAYQTQVTASGMPVAALFRKTSHSQEAVHMASTIVNDSTSSHADLVCMSGDTRMQQ
eukprot:5247413-Amphidinium_carterae.2